MDIENSMKIEETFSNLEEIRNRLEKEGFVCRISFDETDEDVDFNLNDIEMADFVAEANPKEVEKWEAELPDSDEKEETGKGENEKEENEKEKTEKEENEREETEKNETDWNRFQTGPAQENPVNAEVVYFDLFKKKAYVKTLIFQKEEEEGIKVYKLIGFCEAPMG